MSGVAALKGDIMLPLHGVWTADVSLANLSPPSVGRRVTLTMLGSDRRGTVVAAESPYGRAVVHAVGGAGGVRQAVLDPTDYGEGIPLSTVVRDALEHSGEVVGDLSALDSVVLETWSSARGASSDYFQRLLRVVPDDVALQVDASGSWFARKLDWTPIYHVKPENEVTIWPAENAARLFVEESLKLVPGTSVNIRGVQRKIGRAQYEVSSTPRVTLWFVP